MVINLIDRVKHSFSKDKKLSSALYGILGFYPHNLEYYRAALAHKSQSYRNRAGKPVNNERLEYLGDAILEAVVSDIVFHRYPRKREGFLTSTRSKIVQRSSLNKLSADLGLDRLIKTTALPGPKSNNIGGNAFEALMGAVYLDRGYHHCQWFIEKRIIGRLLDIDGVANKEVNFKSKLLEWTQKNRILAEYALEQQSDDNNANITFCSTLSLEGIVAGVGTGHSKKESQQIAAKEALTKLRREPKFLDSIYRAKEKRTAMEADEICVVPRIDEIEEEITKQANPQMSPHAKLAPQRPQKNKNIAAKTAKKEAKATAKAAVKPVETDSPKSSASNKKQSDNKEKDAQATSAPKPQKQEQSKPNVTNDAPIVAVKETVVEEDNINVSLSEQNVETKEETARQPRPARRRGSRRPRPANNADTAEETKETAEVTAEEANADKNSNASADDRRSSAPRDKSRRYRRSTALPQVEGTPRNAAEAEREAIVRMAEEAAYSQNGEDE